MRANDQLVVSVARRGHRDSRMTVGRVNLQAGRSLVVKTPAQSFPIARTGSKLVLGELPDSWSLSMRSETRPPSGHRRLANAVILMSIDVPSLDEIEMVLGAAPRAPRIARAPKPSTIDRVPVVLDVTMPDEIDLEVATPAERRVRQLLAELVIERRALFVDDPPAASRCEQRLIAYLFGEQRGGRA